MALRTLPAALPPRRGAILLRLAALALPLAALACGGPDVPNLHSDGSTIVCLGDSITAGVGAAADEAYPARLAELLGVEVVNAGVSGDTTADGLARLDAALAADPWLVIVGLGGNDMLRRLPAERAEENLRALVDGVLAAGAVPMLVEIEGPFGGAYGAMFDRLEEDYDLPVVEDVLGDILTDRALKSDAIHPNAAGYDRLARAVADEVEPLLAARRRLGLTARKVGG
ncbi:MAG TPA: GDSL-type esterase/lipase family protein [Thermoanaerobaculia bacterium]|nr:GDSL-type esterase/lipase family protein [Thermoanaerobaculia bacterium]